MIAIPFQQCFRGSDIGELAMSRDLNKNYDKSESP